MSLPYKIGFTTFALWLAATAGYMAGRHHGREATLKAAVQAYQMREKINDKVDNMDGFSLCLALGGVSDECTTLMRGLDETAAN